MARSQTGTAYKSRFPLLSDLSDETSINPISYKNGTILNIAKIDASSAYNNMISRLSLKSSKHLHPPYASLDDYFSDQPRQAARQARKAAGLPSSPEGYEIARLLASLPPAAEAFIGGRKMSGAVATIPLLLALYAEDLKDAFEYVGIFYIPHYPFWFGDIFSETAAVYSGYGFGLCSNYTDIDSCDEERHHPPHQNHTENVLSVSYIRSSLTCTWAVQGMWFAFPAADEFKVVDYDLG
ncbi:hypothetical protein DL95DRAFT_478168 [Leptodontidium sp. 2 PMI_412]|nr:hypothetical protein DL95DRAFT_478168 [Leptodontidium sp. 2 PMI_412]